MVTSADNISFNFVAIESAVRLNHMLITSVSSITIALTHAGEHWMDLL